MNKKERKVYIYQMLFTAAKTAGIQVYNNDQHNINVYETTNTIVESITDKLVEAERELRNE